ncbi:cupin domain-containing protein [Streptacidiphilus sp. N1-3]|uniref:Cupin domain-containing protein n=1 Tax=Streptacidiphilus alkalitolerans TaxID=3342712 RepID=A0ABV6X0I8_9ACTN
MDTTETTHAHSTEDPQDSPDPVLKLPGCGENLGAIGLGIMLRLTGEDTDGAYSLFEYIVPAGLGGPPTHIHEFQDELFTCSAGEIVVELDGVARTLTPGASMLLPRKVPHVFYNRSDQEARIIAVVSPPGLEQYYRELSQLPPGPRDMAKIVEVMKRHGLSLAPRADA